MFRLVCGKREIRFCCSLLCFESPSKKFKKSHSGHTDLSTNLYHFEGFWWQTKDLTFDWLCARFHGFPMKVKKDINSWLKGFWGGFLMIVRNKDMKSIIGRAVGTLHLSKGCQFYLNRVCKFPKLNDDFGTNIWSGSTFFVSQKLKIFVAF